MTAEDNISLRLIAIGHAYPRLEPVLKGVDFVVGGGEIVAIVGRSGSGKSTLLHIIAGFISPSEGRVLLKGRRVETPTPSCVLMFQESSLYPWMSVAENVGLGLRFARRDKTEEGRLAALLRLVQLEDFAEASVQRLSGGQQQRVAFARALALHPRVLLLDEPFSGLDPLTRADLQHQVRAVAQRIGLSLVIVTHDFDEALAIADRVLILAGRPGRIVSDVAITLDDPRRRDSAAFATAREHLAAIFSGTAASANIRSLATA